MSKYDKSFEIFLTNKSGDGLKGPKTLYTFNFSKPIIIPPMSSYSLTNLASNRTTTNQISYVFSINEFPNKVYVADQNGGRMFNGFLYMTPKLKNTTSNVSKQHTFHICNKQELTLSTITLRISDIDGKPRFLTTNGAIDGGEIELGLNIKIEQDPRYEIMNIQKRNQELMAGLIAQRKEIEFNQ
tara:strand:- start:5595 stop:6149 length:555 start_codon:yes stop_codon:yes gene_type:complete